MSSIMDKLFNNPGATIKSFAKGAFWVIMIATVILALVNSIEVTEIYNRYLGDYENEYDFYFWEFVTTLLIGISSAIVELVLLYAYGELVENSTYIRNKIDVLDELKNQGGTVVYAASPAAPSPYRAKTVEAPSKKSSADANGEVNEEEASEAAQTEEPKGMTAKRFIENALMFRGAEGTLGYVKAHYNELNADDRKYFTEVEYFIGNGNAEALRRELEKMRSIFA